MRGRAGRRFIRVKVRGSLPDNGVEHDVLLRGDDVYPGRKVIINSRDPECVEYREAVIVGKTSELDERYNQTTHGSSQPVSQGFWRLLVGKWKK